MKKLIAKSLAVFSGSALLASSALAGTAFTVDGGAGAAKPAGSGPTDLAAVFGTIANVLIFLVGAISVIVIIYGGFLYVTSTGDSKRVEAAKSTILYAVIGIIVAVLAYAIVNFVIGSLK